MLPTRIFRTLSIVIARALRLTESNVLNPTDRFEVTNHDVKDMFTASMEVGAVGPQV